MVPFRENITNWIFVTGLPRSGTTFVGKVLSLPWSVDYLHEPFNPLCGIPSFEKLYTYLRPGPVAGPLAETYYSNIQALMRYDVRFKNTMYARDTRLKRMAKRVVGSRGLLYLRLAKLNPFHRAAVIKDPTGLYLTEFLSHHFPVKPVIVLRHPVASVASYLRIGWIPPLLRLNNQPALVEDYLSDDQHLLTKDWNDTVPIVAVFWRMAYKVLLQQAKRHPDWYIVRHEDLSANPTTAFQEMYGRLDLPWSDRVEKKIQKMTGSSNPAEARGDRVQDFRRDSAAIFHLRRNALTREQRRQIFDLVEEVATPYYARDSFDID